MSQQSSSGAGVLGISAELLVCSCYWNPEEVGSSTSEGVSDGRTGDLESESKLTEAKASFLSLTFMQTVTRRYWPYLGWIFSQMIQYRKPFTPSQVCLGLVDCRCSVIDSQDKPSH